MKLMSISLMNFLVNNQENFQTNSPIHSINTSNKHHLHRPTANLSCFQKSTFYSSIRIFNSLPCNIKNLKNEKAQFKAALRRYFHDKWVPVTTAWRVLGLRMEERPPNMEGSCEYAVADSRQGVVLQLGGWARC
jgi:hypothetical protein